MKVLVFVEGESDKSALIALFREPIAAAQNAGIGIRFLPVGGKSKMLRVIADKASRILKDSPRDYVFALPDLYPIETSGPDKHRTAQELIDLMKKRFRQASRCLKVEPSAKGHFRPHCLKHDLEVLLLAAEEALARRLGTEKKLHRSWRNPVETQNDQRPPKVVIKRLFRKHRPKRGYDEIADARSILASARLSDVEAACPERFAPFSKDLQSVVHKLTP